MTRIPRWLSFVGLLVLAGCHGSPERSGSQDGEAHPGHTVTNPKGLPREFHCGVNHAHIHRRGHGYGSQVSADELASLKKLGVDWIAITPFGYQSGATANQIFGFPGYEGASEFFSTTDPTLTDKDLEAEITAAHALGLRVTLKPHIWAHDFWHGREWHGSIRQLSSEDHERWWASYRALTKRCSAPSLTNSGGKGSIFGRRSRILVWPVGEAMRGSFRSAVAGPRM